ncbi:hypothetical protein F3P66_02290 [Agrobacterium fabrum]|nr:hypothetical protein F3P66_02290 [Agrobacterium fabrum]TRB29156.1 hypothetical protein EXN51_11465 [Agrobacterium fabrum]
MLDIHFCIAADVQFVRWVTNEIGDVLMPSHYRRSLHKWRILAKPQKKSVVRWEIELSQPRRRHPRACPEDLQRCDFVDVVRSLGQARG